MSLEQQVAIITGASQGIGHAVAEHLAKRGMNLVLSARNASKLEQLQQSLSSQYPQGKFWAAPCDVRNAQAVKTLVQEAHQRFGRIDVLINNAGVAPTPVLFQESSIEDIDRTIDTNLKGPMYWMHAVLPHMVHQHRGVIININSVAGKTAYPFWATYVASKFGLGSLTEAVSEEQRANGIKIIGIHPGPVDTPIWDNLGLESNAQRDGMLLPKDIAEAVVYALDKPDNVFVKEITLTQTVSTI